MDVKPSISPGLQSRAPHRGLDQADHARILELALSAHLEVAMALPGSFEKLVGVGKGGAAVKAQVDIAFLGADHEQRVSVTGAPADSPVLLVGGLDGARQVAPEQRSQPAGKPGGPRIAAGEEDLEGRLTPHGLWPGRNGSVWHPSETASRRMREKGERRARRLPGVPRGGKGSFGTP